MGQRCGALDLAQTTCRDPRQASCICRHAGDQRSLETEDEQDYDDAACHFIDSEVGRPSSQSSATGATRHVENLLVPRGGVYTGQVREDGQPDGQGSQRWSDGTVYSGTWNAGAAHGRGKLVKADGSGYEGNWLEGRKHGAGFERLVDQSEYNGDFVDGQKHGNGTFRWKGGARYSGEFCEDALQGNGIFVWGDGRSYEGQWVQSRMHGQGKFDWPDGKHFGGKYENDKKHGPGVFTWPDGSNCIGIWHNGKQHGLGTHVNSNGAARKGRWKNGNLEEWLDPLPSATGESSAAAESGLALPVTSRPDKTASNGVSISNANDGASADEPATPATLI